MNGGYMGRILEVNLSKMEIRDFEFPEKLLKKYIGGVGIGAKILFDKTSALTNPFAEENVLMFLTGPLTNTKVPTSGRYSVIVKSPLGMWGEGDSGGRFGPALKSAGFDGVVITGKSAKPVYLHLHNGEASICDASHIWGKDTFETDSILKKETSPKAVTCAIGLAGENMVNIAAIINDGPHGRAAGRGGLGAVMGSKRLKGIAAHGELKTLVAKKEELSSLVKLMSQNISKKTVKMKQFGTAGGVLNNHDIGDMPNKNWRLGDWHEKIGELSGQKLAKTMLKKKYYCGSCTIGCGRTVESNYGPYAGLETGGPEYESLASFGSLLLINDLKAVALGHELCNRYGIDVVSAGASIAFAMEAYEKGLLTKTDTDNIELTWGNTSAMINMIHKIGKAEGLGAVLGKGVRAASEIFGPESKAFAIEVKGLEFPMHDPRSLSSFAISFATSPRGACHRGCSQYLERFGIPQLGIEKPIERQADKGKGRISAIMQDYSTLFNTLKLCHFIIPGTLPSEILACLNYVTGWEMEFDEFIKAGTRIFNLKKLYNCKMGFDRKDDYLPDRIKNCKLSSGGAKNYVPDLEMMLSEYYKFRGWDENGKPKVRTLEHLDLKKEGKFLYNRLTKLPDSP